MRPGGLRSAVERMTPTPTRPDAAATERVGVDVAELLGRRRECEAGSSLLSRAAAGGSGGRGGRGGGGRCEAAASLLARAAAGSSGVLVVRGEAGIGKTALVEHAADTAARSGFRVQPAGGVEYAAQVGFAGPHQLRS